LDSVVVSSFNDTLINFWFTQIQAGKSAIEAVIMNRIGDFGSIVGIVVAFICHKSDDHATAAALTPFFKTDM